MKKTFITKLSLVLALLMMCALVSCDLFGQNKDPWEDAIYTENTEVGTGSKIVEVEVVVKEHSVTFTIHTDAETLGEALIAHGIIEGEQGEYGIYIKRVNGILADYDVDGSYWGFYQNGEYVMSGVDFTAILGGEHFELVYSK